MYRRIILSNSPVFEFSIFSWYNFNFVVRYSNSQKNVHKMKIKNAFLRWFLKLFQYALKISTKNATMLLSLPEFLNSLLFSFSLSLKIYFFLNRISRGSGRFSMHLNFFWKLPNIWKWSRNKATLSLSLFNIYVELGPYWEEGVANCCEGIFCYKMDLEGGEILLFFSLSGGNFLSPPLLSVYWLCSTY